MLTGCDSDATEGIYAQMLTAQTSVSYTTKQMTGYDDNETFLSLEDTGIYKVVEGSNNAVSRNQIVKGNHLLDDGTQRITSIYSANGTDLYYILGKAGNDSNSFATLYYYNAVPTPEAPVSDPLQSTQALDSNGYNPQQFTANGYLVGINNGKTSLALLSKTDLPATAGSTITWPTTDNLDIPDDYGLASVVPVLNATVTGSRFVSDDDSNLTTTNYPFVVTQARSTTDKRYYYFYLYDGSSYTPLTSAGGDGDGGAIKYDLISATETEDGKIIGVLNNGDMVYINSTTVKEFAPSTNYSFTKGSPRSSFLINNGKANLVIMDTSSDMIVYTFDSSTCPTSDDDVSISCVTNGYASDLSGVDEITSFIKNTTNDKKYVVATTSCGYYTITFSDDPTDGDGTGYASVEGIDFSE
jgi:hypothetical protein